MSLGSIIRSLSALMLTTSMFLTITGCGQKSELSSPRTESKPPQGIIVIVADSLRPDHMNLYGYGRETAPNLAAVASQGAVFQDCISQSTCSAAAVSSILTSMYPTSHTVQADDHRLPDRAEILAELCQKAGYATVAASWIPAASNVYQGFETFLDLSSVDSENFVRPLLPWLQNHKDAPFFVFLHFPRPLSRVYGSGQRIWADPEKQKRHEDQLQKLGDVSGRCMPTVEQLERAQIDPIQFKADAVDLYDDSLHQIDSQVGQVVNQLRELGLREKTTIAFVGSYGQDFADHTGVDCGLNIYGEISNVPLLLVNPGTIVPGAMVKETVESIDLMPTLLEMCGISLPDEVQGSSLLALLGESDPASFTWGSRPAVTEGICKAFSSGVDTPCAVVLKEWKLVYKVRSQNGQPEFELFDHRKDPFDRVNVAAENPQIVQDLKKELEGWRERVNSARIAAEAAPPSNPSSDKMEQLKSLGYL